MKLHSLSIRGFRGIQSADVSFGQEHTVLLGPNRVGKSTIIDAMSLVFNRGSLVRDLTEHDFHGSCPDATSRIKVVATLGGFKNDDPDCNHLWFRDGRAVPKWWNALTGKIEPEPSTDAKALCAQIAYAARFDLEELAVESKRYFHDDNDVEDPFQEDAIHHIPNSHFNEIGYFVLPSRRNWVAAATFASELFRKAVAISGGIPAKTILEERDRLREPEGPLERTNNLAPFVENFNRTLGELLPDAPSFQLRITSTDSESLLRALVPHYDSSNGISLPVDRHGMGLLSLQTFVLLLELGRARVEMNKPFLLAMEEPELHIPPGMQRRLISKAISIADQTISTSHSPRIAAFFAATHVQILDSKPQGLTATSMLRKRLDSSASNAQRKLFHDDRVRLVEALMYQRVLIPEGRSEYEWFRLLNEVLETRDITVSDSSSETPVFGTIVGVIPTHEGAVAGVYKDLSPLRAGLVPLVDGDEEGIKKIRELHKTDPKAKVILKWRDGWEMEDAIGWILQGDEGSAMAILKNRIDRHFESVDQLIDLFKIKHGSGRLKTDYLAYEDITTAIGQVQGCRTRAADLLGAISLASLGKKECSDLVRVNDDFSTGDSTVYCLGP